MPSAPPLAGVGELGEVLEQAAALVGCQRGGRARPLGGGGGSNIDATLLRVLFVLLGLLGGPGL